jgi:hypothetical protein
LVQVKRQCENHSYCHIRILSVSQTQTPHEAFDEQ